MKSNRKSSFEIEAIDIMETRKTPASQCFPFLGLLEVTALIALRLQRPEVGTLPGTPKNLRKQAVIGGSVLKPDAMSYMIESKPSKMWCLTN